ncbi:MAG: response regulator [Clostridiaceae bacterium]|nr:response regulator [Clostridiaceae bacterium]
MFRALIVDDEPIAIDSIEYIIKNNFSNLEVGGRAKSGREAIEKAYNIRPDIVLIDIKMPGINGLEAIRKIQDMNPDAYFIIISAYDYFDYATEALSLGVVEYLLKPVKEVRLVEALKKAIDIISQKRNRISWELEMKEKFEIVIPALENGFINSICMFEDNAEELKNFSNLFELEGKGGYIMAIEFGEREEGRIQNKISASVKTQSHYGNYRDILKSLCECIIGPIMFNRLIVYVLQNPDTDSFAMKLSAIKLAEEFSNKVRNIFGEVSIGMGRYYTDVLDAKKSFREAMQALQYLSRSSDFILHIDDMIEEYHEDTEFDGKVEQEIYIHASKGDLNSALVTFDNIFDQIVLNCGELDEIKDKCIVLVVEFSKRWEHIKYNFRRVLEKIMNASSQGELRSILKKYIETIVDKINISHQEKVNSIIETADEYMRKNYAKDITLDDIAREVNLSPYYFSRFYKEQSGVNFIDRLISIRIEKAKQYIEQTDLSLKEISGLVGYSDPNYFSKLFKKVTGYTATEYKESYRK